MQLCLAGSCRCPVLLTGPRCESTVTVPAPGGWRPLLPFQDATFGDAANKSWQSVRRLTRKGQVLGAIGDDIDFTRQADKPVLVLSFSVWVSGMFGHFQTFCCHSFFLNGFEGCSLLHTYADRTWRNSLDMTTRPVHTYVQGERGMLSTSTLARVGPALAGWASLHHFWNYYLVFPLPLTHKAL